jgi:outer membrane beta-barrel protein
LAATYQGVVRVKLGLLVLATVWLAIVAASWTEASEGPSRAPASSPEVSNDEYSFDWLDPDKKIYVLQNRKFTKAEHVLVSAMVGPGMSNSYRDVYAFEGRAAYYLSEMFGIETFYAMQTNRENATYDALKIASPNALPTVREVRSQYGAMLHYVPWYAKINVFNKILYFDWYFSGGAATVHTALDTRTKASDAARFTTQDLLGFTAGTGHQYHLTQNFIVRLDFTGTFYSAPILGDSGDKSWFSNYIFGVGIGYKL